MKAGVSMILLDHRQVNLHVVRLIDSCVSQQAADAGKPASPHHSLLVAANQAAVINAAKSASASATPGGALSKTAVTTLVKGTVSSAAKATVGSAAAVGMVAKGVTSMPVVSMSKGAGALVSVPKGSGTSLVTTASLVGGAAAGGAKTGATLSGTQRQPCLASSAPDSAPHVARPVLGQQVW